MRPEQLSEELQAELNKFVQDNHVFMVQSSCYTDEGVMDVRNTVRRFY